ncbi:mannitol dehydrogenase family protein [Pelagerythrobacter marensis]|uniref:Mannitol dehydrogenase, C-terminal domain n=1 Tax=Pelagerythrobacter marensis TaxID=543877 RepID=A0A0G3XE20_9SPHN|nr:mannitol dehydrogenase family protein [Pelagerythrobacter marensis]AKM08598.1 Mannitol dehydrogenase, C-terminal domain [Pelagerythrobacter marensis]
MRLGPDTLGTLPAEIAQCGYDRAGQAIGVVHFGIGAFHRAHQAWYLDRAMAAGERDWAISALTLRSPTVAEQLGPQDGLYSLTERAGAGERTRVIGAVREVLFARPDAERAIERVAAPECRIVSFTVTEKGYCRAESGGLDLERAQESFYPVLSAALAQRAARGQAGVTLLSCDNLAGNGAVLHGLVREWLAAHSPDTLAWFEANCTSPSTMVDRIVPRTTEADLQALEERLGLEDRGAVFTERFSQWVIEDDFAARRPRWEELGVQMVADVAPYEAAKLRMLNGAHSLLAYCGLRAGHTYVHEAAGDPALRQLAERLMVDEAMPTLDPAPGQDLAAYARDLLTRFADPALRHRLDQIAMDGTQKIPQRWLDTAAWHCARGQAPGAIREAFDAWCWHLADARFVDDPEAKRLVRAASGGGRQTLLDACFGGGAGAPLWPEYAHLRPLFEGRRGGS